MTKDTARKVAKWNSSDEIQSWSSGVAKFSAEAQPDLRAAMGRACGSCPFRNKGLMGGCIGEECPVHATWKGIALAMKRTAAAVKEIYKAKYAMP